MKTAKNKYGIESNLTVTNKDNERQVEKMVSEAMHAYANWQEVDSIPYLANGYDKAEAKGRFEAKYEATVSCIGLFVEQPTSSICFYIESRCYEEFGI